MLQLRKASDRGRSQLPWLDSFHTFSFGEYYDPAHMGFSVLRVINDDTVAPGAGFGRHGHRDMEIITYVLSGALEHKDSLGNGSIIRPGEVQRMSAASGILHSEYNASQHEAAHFLQIWIEPSSRGGEPSYAQTKIEQRLQPGTLMTLASGDGRDGSLRIKQDAAIHLTHPATKQAVAYRPEPGRRTYVHVARGNASVNGISLQAGDGLAVETGEHLHLTSADQGEVLLFDLP